MTGSGADDIRELLLSATTMRAIYKTATGGDLSDEVAQAIAQDMSRDVFGMLETIEAYAYHNRSDQITEEDVRNALKDDADYANDMGFQLDQAYPFPGMGGQGQAPATAETAASITGWQGEEAEKIQPPNKFPLTKEQQDFYKKVMAACFESHEDVRAKAIKSMEVDPSLEAILPQLITSMMNSIKRGFCDNDIAVCFTVIHMATALAKNKSISFDQSFYFILPGILSCILIQHEFERVDVEGDEVHWQLREIASELMGDIVRVDKNYNLLDRIIRILSMGLCNHEHLLTIYGAVIGFGQLGSCVVETYLLPELSKLSELLYAGDKHPRFEQGAIKKIWSRLIRICAPIVKSVTDPPDRLDNYLERYGRIGEELYGVVIGIRVTEHEAALELTTNLVLEVKKKAQFPVSLQSAGEVMETSD
ncbi:transcription initiation factor TFIID subunit 6-like [Drosophila guanche]|uniref:Blast:Transcription initiation factor TFIID subunit 6 n=1 Tax=Drosophila guanche TaxID=7266 RepID=A0A3B0JT12_DROGU|nr:transcription initiation factor TFIID subunit 6-like [Drosophila guanche]XP_034134019.1 transcription initiation factor TFIID subunit 6-like [Drosophila guanche]SPP85235.1 blast:Transcription initiation factor TFIID subunit 6 [Drosophila guanche]